MKFHAVCRIDEIPVGQGRAFDVNGKSIAIFHTALGYFAIDDQCPHMGASLAAGYLENCIIACPWHAWRFDVRDGTWCDNPRVKIDTSKVRVEDGWVSVAIESHDSPNTQVPNPDANPPQNKLTAVHVQPITTKGTMADSKLQDETREVSLNDFQALIRRMYYEKDVARGVEGTFMWLMQEVGELATSLRENDPQNRAEEFADVLAWLATIANVCQVDLAEAVRNKYGRGCPGCQKLVCVCPDSEKP